MMTVMNGVINLRLMMGEVYFVFFHLYILTWDYDDDYDDARSHCIKNDGIMTI